MNKGTFLVVKRRLVVPEGGLFRPCAIISGTFAALSLPPSDEEIRFLLVDAVIVGAPLEEGCTFATFVPKTCKKVLVVTPFYVMLFP